MTSPRINGTGSPHGGPVSRFPRVVAAHYGRAYGLGRHINHDPRSRAYAYPVQAAPLVAVRHERRVPIFDQGDLGFCTACASLGILGTEPYYTALRVAGMLDAAGRIVLPESVTGSEYWGVDRIAFNEAAAKELYHEITDSDPFEGTYPPDDTGSDGLSSAKVITALGLVPGYEHTFSLTAALDALQTRPLLVGTSWTDDMFTPDPYGRIRPTGRTAGGHEWILDEYQPTSRYGLALVGGTTSWGTSFGVSGRFYMSATDFGKLLASQGDVIVLTPVTAAAPQPSPAPASGDSADVALAAAMRKWMVDKSL
jgi:hypothetical protein